MHKKLEVIENYGGERKEGVWGEKGGRYWRGRGEGALTFAHQNQKMIENNI